MRAEPMCRNHTIGSKWLRQGGTFPVNIPANNNDLVDKEAGTNHKKGGEVSTTKSGISVDKAEMVDKINLSANQGNEYNS